MARDQPYTMVKPRPRDVSNPIASGSKRPSAFDRFPGDARNNWLNEIQAKIDRAIYPPPPPGPSRSPSPLEHEVVVEDIEGYMEHEEDVVGSEEYEEDGSDEDEGYDEGEDMNPLALGSQPKGLESEDGFYEDDEDVDDDEDEGFEDDQEMQDNATLGQPPVFEIEQRLEDEDPFRQDLIDPQVEDQLEGEYDEDSEDQEEEDELEGEESHLEDREDAGTEDDVMYVGDTDEEEEEESEDGQDAEMLGEDEDELEEDELDDDGMGDLDESTGGLPLEQEGLEVEQTYQATPVGVEDGQLVYDLPSSQMALPEVTYTNPYQLVDPQTSEIPIAQASNPLYPPLPEFTDFTPAFTSAAQMIPPWEPTPLADQIASSVQAMENDLIDPSLLADFAQRVEAQASGDLDNTTESQNTSEMTALADAVMNQYDEPAPVPQLGQEVEVFQHGMGEAEGDGYEEDRDSQSSSGTGAELRKSLFCITQDRSDFSASQSIPEDQAESDEEQEGYSDEEMESGDGQSRYYHEDLCSPRPESESVAASPEFINTADDPIEVLSSDEEEDEEDGQGVQDAQEDEDERSQSSQEEDELDDDEEEDEEEEELEPERPAASHIRFDVDRSDLLSPSRASSRSSARTPVASQPVSPSALAESFIPAEEVDELEEDGEDDAKDSERTPSPVVAEPEIPSAIPIMDPIQRATSIEPLPVQQSPEGAIMETTEDIQVDDSYEVEEPISPGPSLPLVTPAVELPLDAVFPTVPEAGLDAILRVFTQQPEVEEEEDNEIDDGPEQLDIEVEDEIVAVQSTSALIDEEEVPVEDEIVAEEGQDEDISSDEDEVFAGQSAIVTVEEDGSPAEEEIMAGESTSMTVEDGPLGQDENMAEETRSVVANEYVVDSTEIPTLPAESSPAPVPATDYAIAESTTDQLPDPHAVPSLTDLTTPDVPFHRSREPSLVVEPPAQAPDPESVALVAVDYAMTETISEVLPDPHAVPSLTDLTTPDVPFHRSREPSLIVEPPAQAPDLESVAPVAIDYAMIESTSEVLPDPHAEPVATELTMPDVPFHRSRTPSLIVEPPANPPNPEIVIDRPTDEELVSPTDLPDPQAPIPDSHLPQPLAPHITRPAIERSPSTFVNVQEVDIMLDPGPNDDREDTPVEFPEHDQPAPQTDLIGPIEPEDLSPRDEPRSVSMEALAPGEAPLEEMIMTGTGTGTANSREESPVLFPGPGEAAPNTYNPSPLDVRRDLPLDIDVGSDIAPSLNVEPPSEPMTGPPSLTGSGGEEVQPNLLGLPDMVDDQEEESDAVPTSSSIDVPSAPLRAATPDNEDTAGPSNIDNTRFLSPLRHHHGRGPRQASVPPPATRATRRHTRQSSHAVEALTPPVTRQNCHYRKLYIVQDDMSAVVLVPQCTLTDHDKMQEEHAEDRGDATPADEAQARQQPICETTPRLQLALTAKLHRIVGSDIFDEAQKTYLLQASQAALLPDEDEEEETEIVASTSKTRRASTSTSPIKPRRSKRLSEAPSETSIKEEPTTGHRRATSIAKTASPVPEAEETDANVGEPYNLRSQSEVPAPAPEVQDEVDMDSNDAGTEIIVDDEVEPQVSSSLTPLPSSASKKDDHPPSSKRYSLRSQPDIQDSEETKDRPTTPSPTAPEAQTTPILMTTRLRARESAGPSTSAKSPSANEQHVKFEEPSTPQLKGRRQSQGKGKGKGKGKAEDDTRYVYEDEEEEDEDEIKEDEEEREVQSRQSTAEIIPFDQIQPDSHSPSTTSGTGIKKRKLRSNSNSPWQLRGFGNGEETDNGGSPSGGRGKRRAVESKEEPDVPVPEEVEEEEELAPLPPPKGWMSYIWPFKRS
jgi:hypothetical protein